MPSCWKVENTSEFSGQRDQVRLHHDAGRVGADIAEEIVLVPGARCRAAPHRHPRPP